MHLSSESLSGSGLILKNKAGSNPIRTWMGNPSPRWLGKL